jgi:hypothetical protein
MSIKVAHVIFVVSTTLMAAGGAYWADQGGLRHLCWALTAVALALPIYGVLFYRKLKKHPTL